MANRNDMHELQAVFGDISDEDCKILMEEFCGKDIEEVTQNILEAMDSSGFSSITDLVWHIRENPAYGVRRSRSFCEKNTHKDSWSVARSRSSNTMRSTSVSNNVMSSSQQQSHRVLPTVAQLEASKQGTFHQQHSQSQSMPFSGTQNPIRILRNTKNLDQVGVRAFLTKYMQDTEMRNILYEIQERRDDKILILLRGASGSGKSTLALVLWSITERGDICSADLYFTNRNGHYVFDRSALGEAHKSCKNLCKLGMSRGDSPIVIDNTNTTVEEMMPYVEMAVDHNYEIKILEPKTEWKTKPGILAQKNTHGVPKRTIEAQLERFEKTTVKSMVDRVMMKRQRPQSKSNLNYRPTQELDWGQTSSGAGSNDQWISAGRPHAQSSGMRPGLLPTNSAHVRSKGQAPSPLSFQQTNQLSWTDPPPVAPASPMMLSELLPDLKLVNNGNTPKPKRANKRNGIAGAVGQSLVRQATSSKSQQLGATSLNFEDPAHQKFEQLCKLFPNVAKDKLEDIFNLHEGELDDCASVLMEQGIEMTGSLDEEDEQLILNEIDDISPVSDDRCEDPFDNCSSKSTCSTGNTKILVGSTEEDDDEIFPVSPYVAGSIRNEYGLDGAAGGSTEYDNETFELVLPVEFARVLLNAYGHPDDEQRSLSLDELTVKVPVDAAFEIYKSLYLNLHKTEMELARQNSSDESERSNSPDSYTSDAGGSGMQPLSLDDELNAIAISISQMDLETRSGNPSLAVIQDIEAKLCEKTQEAYRCFAAPNRTMAQNINFSMLKQEFIYLDPSVVDEVYIQCFLNVDKTRAWLNEMYPNTSSQFQASKAVERNSSWNLKYNPKDVQLYSPRDLATFERTYNDLDQEYRALMSKMRNCHEKCKTLSNPQIKAHYIKEANEINDKIKALADEMQYYRAISINSKHKNDQILDLHGLKISGAMRVLKEFLWFKEEEFLNAGIPKMILLIITGQGKHSRNGSPVLQPAVNNFLRQRKYIYHTGKPGSFTVIFTKSSLRGRRNY